MQGEQSFTAISMSIHTLEMSRTVLKVLRWDENTGILWCGCIVLQPSGSTLAAIILQGTHPHYEPLSVPSACYSGEKRETDCDLQLVSIKHKQQPLLTQIYFQRSAMDFSLKSPPVHISLNYISQRCRCFRLHFLTSTTGLTKNIFNCVPRLLPSSWIIQNPKRYLYNAYTVCHIHLCH